MRLYVIRHALPDYNQPGVYHRPPGPGLTAEGVQQAAALVPLLRSTNIQHLVVSPLLRCRLTAEPLAQALNLDMETDEDVIDQQPEEKPADVNVRMLRAVLNRSNSQVIALVSHAAPLENLLKTLTRNAVQLPERDRRGCYLREGSVWRAVLHEGQWEAKLLPVDGYSA